MFYINENIHVATTWQINIRAQMLVCLFHICMIRLYADIYTDQI